MDRLPILSLALLPLVLALWLAGGRGPDPCAASLRDQGVAFEPAPDAAAGTACRIAQPVRVTTAGVPLDQPAVLDCPIAADLARLVEDVVRPAARRHFDQDVAEIDQLAGFVCRDVAGTDRPSRHATGQAIDIGGFRLTDGQWVRVEEHWNRTGPEGAFLRDVRDGACRLFSVLGPDYDRAHADHFHLERGRWRICR